MYKDNDLCPICGEGYLKKRTISETFEYKGSYTTVDDYVIYECHECGEAIVDPQTLRDSERFLRDFHREIDCLLTSKEIKKIRLSIGYTQEEFGNILGGGKKSFARYENGTVTQSKPMDNLLRIIRDFPYTLESITEKNPNVEYEYNSTILDSEKN